MAASGSGSGSGYGAGPVSDEDDDVNEQYRVREWIQNPTGDDRYNEEMIQNLLQKEKTFDQNPLQDWVTDGRVIAIDWIIRTREQFKFKFHTAYLTATYIDRFLSKRLLVEDFIHNHYEVPLLSFACLSLAVKLEESRKVDVSQISFGNYNFLSNVIHEKEKDVLSTLEGKIDSVTPFDFIGFLVPKCRKERPKKDVVVATVETIFSTIKDRDFMRHRPSVIAIAATLFAVDPTLTRQSLEIRMNETALVRIFAIDDVYTCYERILQLHPPTSPDGYDMIPEYRNTNFRLPSAG